MYVYVNVNIISMAIKKINLFFVIRGAWEFWPKSQKPKEHFILKKKKPKKDCIKKFQEQSIKDQSKNYT